MTTSVETNPLLMNGSSTYTINQSLRFRSSASAYLNRTPTVAGNQQVWTWSAWVKRGSLADSGGFRLFNADAGGGYNGISIQFQSGQFTLTSQRTSVPTMYIYGTPGVYYDPSSWYHLLISVDTTQAVAANRVFCYINGVQQAFNSSVSGWGAYNPFPQNFNTGINSTIAHFLGCRGSYLDNFYDGYMGEVNFIDGQALTPSSFGAYDSTTGVWQPKKYTGTYGTNGFYLPFSNNSSVSNLGLDFSGNGNNWTVNNVSLTAGSTYDYMLDSPTPTTSGTQPFGNYSTWNPLDVWGSPTFSNGNLTATNANSSRATMGTSSTGKWYYEITCGSAPGAANPVGFGASSNTGLNPASEPNFVNLYTDNFSSTSIYIKVNGAATISQPSGAAQPFLNDVLQFAYDAGSGKFWVGKNNAWIDSAGGSTGNPSTGANPTVTFVSGTQLFPANFYNGGATFTGILNAGQHPYANTPPTGFKSICASNLSTPSIVNGATAMAATLYTGTGAAANINNGTNTTLGTTFKPDLVWVKSRSSTFDNCLYDSVRGVFHQLVSNNTSADAVYPQSLTAFNSTGFSLGTDANPNNSGSTYVGWNWLAGAGTTSSNTAGTITSTVSVNQTAGFSIVQYTGNGVGGATVGHGLGAVPNFVINKIYSTTNDWLVKHSSMASNNNCWLASTTAQTYFTNGVIGDLNSATTITLQANSNATYPNTNGATYITYCWTAIPGFSAFGSYTGNGSTSGPFIYTGFRPRWILFKSITNGVKDWWIIDTSRDPYNICGNALAADLANAESTGNSAINICANGFKCAGSWGGTNTSGETYIYAAFAENPFRYSLAR